MRIGIHDPYLDDLGGGEKYMMSIAQALSDKHAIDVFWDKKEDISQLKQRFSLDLSKVTLVPNIFSSRFSTLGRFLDTKKYDVLIVLSDGSIPFVGAKKLILHIQQPLAHMQLFSLWNKYKFTRVAKFFCNSLYTASSIKEKFHISPTIIYPPVAIHAKQVKKENIILHVGRFRLIDPLTHTGDYKKQSVMIEAFKHMATKGLKNWRFVLAVSVMGKDEKQFEKIKESAKDFPIELLVNKSNEELWDIYSKAKIYWHASGYGEDLNKHPEYAEHFGISTVEAMGAGAVPVVINAGGQKEIVTQGENGLLWNSLEELQNQTLLLAKNSKLLEKLSKNAQKRARDFSYEKFYQAVHNLLI